MNKSLNFHAVPLISLKLTAHAPILLQHQVLSSNTASASLLSREEISLLTTLLLMQTIACATAPLVDAASAMPLLKG
jgi:hypothetical protein